MSPEQLEDQLSPKTDVWALGCIILQLATGQLPYKGLQNDFKICLEACARGPLVHARN